jgi:phosphonate transport system substrate-binding protein
MNWVQRRIDRRRLLLAGAGLAGSAWLAACGSSSDDKKASKQATVAVTSAAAAPATQAAQVSDLNEKGWPRSIRELTLGVIPLEDTVQQKSTLKPLTDSVSAQIGVPVEASITTSYAALVEAQKNKQVVMGYYGALSFLLAEQQFGAVPILVDSTDGKSPGKYNSYLLAGKDSPVKTVADIKGKDFAFVDPASTSGNLFPRAMLIDAGIDPNKDIRGRYAGNHQNAILAIAKGQVPCGASNNLSVDSAVSRGVIAKDDLVILKVSPDIPNGPYAVHPDLDKRAVKKLQEAFGAFTDPAALKALELVGPLIPTDTSQYNFVRQTAKVLNLKFNEKGQPLPVGE